MKTCSKCEETKPDEAFSKASINRDGLRSHCRSCCSVARKRWSEANSEHLKSYQCSDLEARAKREAESRKRNPATHAARQAVYNAVRSGALVKQPCEKCNSLVVEAHHDDYTKPLDVRWLCNEHHNEWHKHNQPIY